MTDLLSNIWSSKLFKGLKMLKIWKDSSVSFLTVFNASNIKMWIP